MGHCVRIVLPVLDDCGTDKLWSQKSDGRNAEILGRIVERWSGVTLSDNVGVWLNEWGDTVLDRTIVAECSIGPWNMQTREWWIELADHVRDVHRQDCVFLSVRDETAMLVQADFRVEFIKP